MVLLYIAEIVYLLDIICLYECGTRAMILQNLEYLSVYVRSARLSHV
jgi:hypothetical protein